LEASDPSRFGEGPLTVLLRCRCASPNANKPHLEYYEEKAGKRNKEERCGDHCVD